MLYIGTVLPVFKQHAGKILLSGACFVMLFLVACGDSDEDVAFRKAICALAAESRDVFVLGGSDGESFYSADGGLSFERGNSNTTSDLTDSEYNLGVVWSVGKGGYLGSQLSLGADYTLSDSGTTEDLYNLKWVTPTIGLAVGDKGVVSRSTDAGITWTSQTIGDSHLRGVDCSSATNCWVVGTGMGLYWSGDAGETFMRLNPDLGLDSTIDFHGVSTPSEGAAWIVGSVGTVFKTTDFGISYSYIDSGTSNSLNDIYVNESGNGFLVGNEYAGTIRDEEIDPLVDTVLLLGVEYKRLVLALTGGSLFFAGTGGALYETPDFGENFIRIPVIVGSTSSSGDFGDDFGDSGSGTSDVGAGTGGKIAEFSLSNADFSFSHNVGQTSCPQKVGEFVITNSGTDSLAMSIAVLNNAPLAADPSGGFELKSGESRTISLFFTCAQASSFAGTLDISGITMDGVLVSKTVQVSGNVN